MAWLAFSCIHVIISQFQLKASYVAIYIYVHIPYSGKVMIC